jgi:hypothetical protein
MWNVVRVLVSTDDYFDTWLDSLKYLRFCFSLSFALYSPRLVIL